MMLSELSIEQLEERLAGANHALRCAVGFEAWSMVLHMAMLYAREWNRRQSL